ncbi:MAG: radical SAM protein [Myxococcota bacterium]|jgi:radical SAM superfamily enzyme YgiQ (UPF0313 family)|nr:radical SAM protein [Myxococcota bacterium]
MSSALPEVVALETSPRARQLLAALTAPVGEGGWPGALPVQTYRDPAVYWDPEDPTLLGRDRARAAAGLVGFLDSCPGAWLLAAPAPAGWDGLADLLRRVTAARPDLGLVLVGELATADPERLLRELPAARLVARGQEPALLARAVAAVAPAWPRRPASSVLAELAASGGGLLAAFPDGRVPVALDRRPGPASAVWLLPPPGSARLGDRLWLQPLAAHPGAVPGAALGRWLGQRRVALQRLAPGPARTAAGLDEAGCLELRLAAADHLLTPDALLALHTGLQEASRPPVATWLRLHLELAGRSLPRLDELLLPLREVGVVSLTPADGASCLVEPAGVRPARPAILPGKPAPAHLVDGGVAAELADRLERILLNQERADFGTCSLVDEVVACVAGRVPGRAARAGAEALAAGWVQEALGEPGPALDRLLQAARTPATAFGGGLEALRLLLTMGVGGQRLRPLEALPELSVDPGWFGLQLALDWHRQRRPGAARELLQRLLQERPGQPLTGVLPPRPRDLDLLRGLRLLLQAAGEGEAARAVSRRVLASPAGRTPADRALHESLTAAPRAAPAAPTPRAPAAGLPASQAPAPPAARGPASPAWGMTLIALARDEELQTPQLPLGPLYLIAALRAAGVEVTLLDWQLASADQFHDVDLLVAALGEPARVVGLSCMADGLPLLVRLVARLREAFPDRVVIAGGPGPSSVAGPLLELVPGLDVVVCGEGEQTAVELFARLRAGGLALAVGCPGTLVRWQGAVHVGPPRPRLRDLDGLPLPAYDAVDLGRYPEISLVTSRGCSYQCSFCDAATRWGRQRVTRSLSRVLEELHLLTAAHGVGHVHLEDDTFLQPRGRVTEFCRRVREELPGLTWGCLGRADALDAPLVDTLAAAGCRSLFLGLESGSDALLQKIGKGFDAATALDKALLVASRFAVRAYFIWGFPDETWRDFLETFVTVGLLRAAGVEACYSLLAPFPGTPLLAHLSPADLRRLPLYWDLPFPCLFRAADVPAERQLIAAHPELFPGFRTLPTPRWEDKRAFATRYWQATLREVFTAPPEPE